MSDDLSWLAPAVAFVQQHPRVALPLVAVGGFSLVFGVAAGFIRPERMPTARTRAAARIVHRYGMAARGSWKDWRALFTGLEEARSPSSTPTPTSVPPAPPARSAAISSAWDAVTDDRVTPTEGRKP